MDNKEVESLVRYRLEQSKENFEEALMKAKIWGNIFI